MQRKRIGLSVVGWAMAASIASGEVVITEIMYDPASDETAPVKTEWVEIYNTGDEAVNLSGWRLADEDATAGPLPQGASIDPGQAIVLVPEGCTEEAFQAAWGDEVRVYPLPRWAGRARTLGLANNPTETNEVLSLRDADNEIVDRVNYQEQSPWPSGRMIGRSIYLLPDVVQAAFNDEGARWRFSEAGTHAARAATQTDLFDARDTGSPGVVIVAEESER